MIRNLSIAAFLLVVGAIAAPSDAHAQWGYMGYNGYNGVGVYSIYDQDRLPYFALHPPVYYSKPVPRTFGYSPFAYPGWVPTPALPQSYEPAMVVNPYVNDAPAADASGERNQPTVAPPAANPPAANRPAIKVGPLQGYKAPRPNTKGFGNAPKTDKSAVVQPLRIVNPHVDGVILNASARKIAE
jgi:hypothetical protein